MKNVYDRRSKQDNNNDIKRVLEILGRNKFLSSLIIVLSLFAGGVYAYFAQPVYESSATVEISNDDLSLSLDTMVRGGGIDDEASLIDTQVEVIKSRNLVEKALDSVGYTTKYFETIGYKESELYKNNPFVIEQLDVKNPQFYGLKFDIIILDDNSFEIKPASKGFFSTLLKDFGSIIGKKKSGISYTGQHNFGDRIETPHFSFVINKVGDFQSSKYSFFVLDKDSAVNDIAKRLNVFAIAKRGSIVKLIYQDNNSLRAKEFLNSLVQFYISESVIKKTSKASSALSFVDEQLTEVSKKLEESARKLENYKEKHNLVNIETESDVTLRSLSDLKTQLAKININEGSFQSLYEEFKRGNYGAISSLAMDYPVIGTLLADLQRAKADKITLLTSLTENHPDVEKSNERIENVKMALESAIESINDSLRERKRTIQDLLYEKNVMLAKIPEKERELADLQRKYQVHEKTYEFLLEKQAEMQINKASTVSSNRILDKAVQTKRPVKPKKSMILGSALILGLIIAMLVAFIREFFDSKVKTREDIVNHTKTPFYGVIPNSKSSEKMFVLEDQQSIATEALRLIRTNLEFIGNSKKSKVIVVSSTVPGEGKTTVATNLSAVFGMGDKKCIVLSLDMRRPMLHHVFSLTNKVGMSTVLSKNSELKEVIWEHKKIKNLDIITSGPIPPNPSELLQSGKIEQVIDELRESYDYIIIDAPPMGSVTDALILMKNADISLVVFRSEFSEKEYVHSLEEMIESYKLENVGLVLNDVKPKNMSQSFFKYSYTYQ